jgi:hypothetical protein
MKGEKFVEHFFRNIPSEWIPHITDDGVTMNTAGAALANLFIKQQLNPDGFGAFTFEQVLFRAARTKSTPFTQPLKNKIRRATSKSDVSFFIRFGKSLESAEIDWNEIDLFLILSWDRSLWEGAPPLKLLTDGAIEDLLTIFYPAYRRDTDSFKKRRQRLYLTRAKGERGKFKRVSRIHDGCEFHD